MTRLDWLALGGVLLLVVALFAGFALYLRTAYRKGGWRRVRTDLVIAIADSLPFTLFASLRISP